MTSPLVIIVIPNWNLIRELSECLDSIMESTYENFQTIVVDNASTDNSIEVVTKHYPWVKLIRSNENLGYAGALNLGILEGLKLGAQYFFALNNDTVVPPETITQLVYVMKRNLEYGIVAPKVLYYDKPEITFSLGDKVYSFLPLPVRFGRKKKDKKDQNTVLEFDYLFGCALLIKKELVEKIGLFDTSYFMFYEDADYCWRTRAAGYKLARVCNVKIYHKASLSVKKERPLMTYLRARNRSRFYRLHRHGIHPYFTYLALLIGSFWKLLMFALSGNYSSIKPFIKGAIHGFFEELPIPKDTELE